MPANCESQAQLDQQIVEQTIENIQRYIDQSADDEDSQWHNAFGRHHAFIQGLFEAYAPEVPRLARGFFGGLGATALALAEVTYGSDEMHPKLYSGTYEQNVLATYHHVGHSRGVTEDMFRYAATRNQRYPDDPFTKHSFGRFAIIGPAHDEIMANDRGNDERQSALLATDLVYSFGLLAHPRDPEIYEGISSTRWDDVRKRQSVDPSRGFLKTQQATCCADLMPICDRRGVYQAVCLAPEDFTKNRYNRALTHEAAAMGVSLDGASAETCMQIIDESKLLQTMLRDFLQEESDFFRTFTPADKELDSYFTGRQDNIDLLDGIVTDYKPDKPGSLTAAGVLERARDYMLEAA